MKKCPACAYRNPDAAPGCSICGRDISSVPPGPEPPPPGNFRAALLLVPGFLLLACGAAFYLLQGSPGKARPALPVPAEEPFDHSGAVRSLEVMAGLRCLPQADRLAVLPLLKSGEERVARAAARTVGAWARSGAAEGEALLSALLAAAASGRDAVRVQAAVEAGFILAAGLPAGGQGPSAAAAVSALAGEEAPELKAAGFFLSSMAGLGDFGPQLREVLLSAAPPASKLYAACALARLGDADGQAYLAQAVRRAESGYRREAAECLAYCASPGAERLLRLLAKDSAPGGAAESAKRALMLRKQLAIIKK